VSRAVLLGEVRAAPYHAVVVSDACLSLVADAWGVGVVCGGGGGVAAGAYRRFPRD